MSHRFVLGLFSLLLVCGMNTAAFARGKPHVKRHVKVHVKKVKKPHPRPHLRHHHQHRGH